MTEVKCQRDRTTYATIFVKPTALIASRGNASTPTEPTERCIVTFRLSVRNGKYKGQRLNCQAQVVAVAERLVKVMHTRLPDICRDSKGRSKQMPNSPCDSAQHQQEENYYCEYHQFEF
jgi:hypothetical protein